MESRSVYRNNLIVYPDLYYIWTYRPKELWKNFYKQTERCLYKKHICGIGFYSRFHARHIVSLMLSKKALLYIHIVRGDKLIKEGKEEEFKELTPKPMHKLFKQFRDALDALD